MRSFGKVSRVSLAVACAFGVAACRHGRGGDAATKGLGGTGGAAGLVYVEISDGLLATRAATREAWLLEAQAQLRYAVGALAGLGATADLDRLDLALDDAHVTASDGGRLVPFTARFVASWSKAAPRDAVLVLPRRADASGLEAFYRAYAADCRTGADVVPSAYWHAYRPGAKGCPLAGETLDKALTVRATAAFAPFTTSGGPDVASLWADKALDAVVLCETRGVFDAVNAALRPAFGEPQSVSASDAQFFKTLDDKGEARVRTLWVGATLSKDVLAVLDAGLGKRDVLAFVAGSSGSLKTAATALASAPFASEAAQLVFVSAPHAFPYVDRALTAALAGAGARADVLAEGRHARAAAESGVVAVLGALAAGQDAAPSYDALTRLLAASGRAAVHPASVSVGGAADSQ